MDSFSLTAGRRPPAFASPGLRADALRCIPGESVPAPVAGGVGWPPTAGPLAVREIGVSGWPTATNVTFSLVEGGIVRASVNPGMLTLADSSGRTKAELSADEQGLAGLSLMHDQKVIAQLASAGRFIVTDPPERDLANLALSDFGADFKSRLITPSEDTTLGKSKDSRN